MPHSVGIHLSLILRMPQKFFSRCVFLSLHYPSATGVLFEPQVTFLEILLLQVGADSRIIATMGFLSFPYNYNQKF